MVIKIFGIFEDMLVWVILWMNEICIMYVCFICLWNCLYWYVFKNFRNFSYCFWFLKFWVCIVFLFSWIEYNLCNMGWLLGGYIRDDFFWLGFLVVFLWVGILFFIWDFIILFFLVILLYGLFFFVSCFWNIFL